MRARRLPNGAVRQFKMNDWENDVADQMSVLVVDDKPQNLLAMRALLADSGLEV